MRVKRDDCGACDTAALVVRLTWDEAVVLANEIRMTPGPWPGKFSERLVTRIEKLTR